MGWQNFFMQIGALKKKNKKKTQRVMERRDTTFKKLAPGHGDRPAICI